MKEAIVQALKKVLYPNGESYEFAGTTLRFVDGSRPVRRKYIDDPSDVVRNDVLQINYFEQNFKPNHVLWDIGSHYGQYSVFAASVAEGNNQVFSFEPDNVARELQSKNIRANKLETKVRQFDVAVSERDGEVSFVEKGGNANSHISKSAEAVAGMMIKKTRSMDSLLKELPKPDFVKIDTEGAEIDILRGGRQLLTDKSIRFVCELHPFAWSSFNVRFEEFQEIITQSGRKLELLDNKYQLSDLPYYGTVLF